MSDSNKESSLYSIGYSGAARDTLSSSIKESPPNTVNLKELGNKIGELIIIIIIITYKLKAANFSTLFRTLLLK